MKLLRKQLEKLWDAETAYQRKWTSQRPSTGQCAVTALLAQDLVGGDLRNVRVNEVSHYFVAISGQIIDLTADQFEITPVYDLSHSVERAELLSNLDTEQRYRTLRERFEASSNRLLPLAEQEHIAIRDPNYVAGSAQRPEVQVFAQSRTDRIPLPDSRMQVGQRIWMKWSSGPIVACSDVQSWHTAEFENGNINEVRHLASGTRLFGLNDYWTQVQDKRSGWVSVVRLRNEHWLDEPIYPQERSRGSSWIYLDTVKKKIIWLSLTWEPPPKTGAEGRSIPAGLKFKVLRRDEYTCRYCGASAPDVLLHVDHIEPWVLVRRHEEENLVTSCAACNLGKSSTVLSAPEKRRIIEESRRRSANMR